MIETIKKYLIYEKYENININIDNYYVYLNQDKIAIICDYTKDINIDYELIKKINSKIILNCENEGIIKHNVMCIIFISDIKKSNYSVINQDCEGIEYFIIDNKVKKMINVSTVNNYFKSEITKIAEIVTLMSEGHFVALKNNNTRKLPKKNIVQTNMSNYQVNTFGHVLKQSIIHIVILNIIIHCALFIIKVSVDEELYYKLVYGGACGWNLVVEDGQIYRLLTCMFLHNDMNHLMGNMISLGVIGNYMENIIGRKKILFIYFSTGIIAGLTSISYNVLIGEPSTVAIGASGALFGLVGALLAMLIIWRRHIGNIGAKRLIVFSILSLYSGFSADNVDNAAHVGGFIAGMVIATIIFYIYPFIKSQKNK